jgi:iron complex outermembrane receptor protein
MQLEDEIRYDPTAGPFGFGANTNYDPTERYGIELEGGWRPWADLRLQASLAWTRAQFRDGPYAGNDVPLVAEWTGSLAAFWDFWRDPTFGTHTLGVNLDYVGESRLENDEANFQPEIPSYVLVDAKLGGEVGAFTYELAVNNVFDESYYAYGVASATTRGAYNVFPLPGRTYWVRGGVRF